MGWVRCGCDVGRVSNYLITAIIRTLPLSYLHRECAIYVEYIYVHILFYT